MAEFAGLNPSLIQKGLRRAPHDTAVQDTFESFPDSEGIKTPRVPVICVVHFCLNPSLIQKGLRPGAARLNLGWGCLNPSLIQKGLRLRRMPYAFPRGSPFESFPDSEGIKTLASRRVHPGRSRLNPSLIQKGLRQFPNAVRSAFICPGLNPSLIQKGLRPSASFKPALAGGNLFESFPDSEGIKTHIRRRRIWPRRGCLNPSLIQKGLRPPLPGESFPDSEGIKTTRSVSGVMFESFPDSEGIKTPLMLGQPANPSLIQKGLRRPRRFFCGRLNPSLIQKGLRPSACGSSA